MSKAKIASTARKATVQHKNDYPGYIRFGYRLPNGLVVTRQNAQIGDMNTPDGEVRPLPISFIDMVPVMIKESINFDHLADVVIFAVQELTDRAINFASVRAEEDAKAQQEEAEQQAYDSKWDALTYEADTKLPNQLSDEDCTCDQCEGTYTDPDSQSDQAEGPCIPLIGSDGEFIYPPDPGDDPENNI